VAKKSIESLTKGIVKLKEKGVAIWGLIKDRFI